MQKQNAQQDPCGGFAPIAEGRSCYSIQPVAKSHVMIFVGPETSRRWPAWDLMQPPTCAQQNPPTPLIEPSEKVVPSNLAENLLKTSKTFNSGLSASTFHAYPLPFHLCLTSKNSSPLLPPHLHSNFNADTTRFWPNLLVYFSEPQHCCQIYCTPHPLPSNLQIPDSRTNFKQRTNYVRPFC